MRLALDDAVLLAVRCFHKNYENSAEQLVHIDDVIRAVARIYALPDQEPTQMINERRLREDNLSRRDGQKINLVSGDKVISLKGAVRESVFKLHATRLLDLEPYEVQLTRVGFEQAGRIERSQLFVDTGIVSRIQDYDRSKTRTKLQEAVQNREHGLREIAHDRELKLERRRGRDLSRGR